jgi:alanine racemase
MLPFTRTVELKLYTQALQHNVAVVRHLAPHSKVLAMVKANAYGHGILPCVLALQGRVDAMGVACMDEAMYIRAVITDIPLVLIEGVTSADDWLLAAQQSMQVVVHSDYQLQWALAAPSLQPVWLKVNTGMNRLGLPLEDALQAALDLHRASQPMPMPMPRVIPLMMCKKRVLWL